MISGDAKWIANLWIFLTSWLEHNTNSHHHDTSQMAAPRDVQPHEVAWLVLQYLQGTGASRSFPGAAAAFQQEAQTLLQSVQPVRSQAYTSQQSRLTPTASPCHEPTTA